jgi:hypothetical protein
MTDHDQGSGARGPGGTTASAPHTRTAARSAPGPGKRTLVESLAPPPMPIQRKEAAQAGEPAPDVHATAIGTESTSRAGAPSAAVQRKAGAPSAGSSGGSPGITPPTGGINKTGFIDNSDGANIRTGPAESGGRKIRDQPLPPATRVFVSGTHPDASAWWYVTAYLDGTMVRGYVQDFRITTELPEPTAKLHQVIGGETAEQLASQEYGSAVRDGHDLRYYENVLLYVNQQQNRAGISGSYQDPGVLGRGSNNVQFVAGHRIWLVSPAYAKALEAVVPSGSLTGGAVAKVKRFVGHLEDILHSVTGAPQYFGEVAGEYAQAIRDHMPEIVGIVAAFIMAEATSAFLAATPTGVGQIAATVIQLGLAAFGAAGAIQAGVEALKHAGQWLTLAWTAQGKDDRIADASKEFLKMLVSIAVTALSALGARANYGNALKIASSMPTGGLPAMAVAGGGQISGGTGAGTGVLINPGTGSFGTAGNAMMQADKDGGGGSKDHRAEKQAEGSDTSKDDRATKQAGPDQPQAVASHWKEGNPLPSSDNAIIDNAKFEKYSMDPSNKGNGGKASAFKQIGYDVETEAGRQAGASDVVTQLKDQLKSTAAIKGKETGFGQRFEVRVRIKGPSGEGTLITVWQLERGEPRLITNWLEVHK